MTVDVIALMKHGQSVAACQFAISKALAEMDDVENFPTVRKCPLRSRKSLTMVSRRHFCERHEHCPRLPHWRKPVFVTVALCAYRP